MLASHRGKYTKIAREKNSVTNIFWAATVYFMLWIKEIKYFEPMFLLLLTAKFIVKMASIMYCWSIWKWYNVCSIFFFTLLYYNIDIVNNINNVNQCIVEYWDIGHINSKYMHIYHIAVKYQILLIHFTSFCDTLCLTKWHADFKDSKSLSLSVIN